jgi:hypothetical protein
MGGFVLRTKQGIRIKTKKIQGRNGGVERESRVTVSVDETTIKDYIKLGVRIGEEQEVTKFSLGRFRVLSVSRDNLVEEELNGVDKFKVDGEKWVAWRIPTKALPGLNGFQTSFALSRAIPEGQTVMWAVAYGDEPFSGNHVYIGYADVTPPEPPRATSAHRPARRPARPRARKQARKKR